VSGRPRQGLIQQLNPWTREQIEKGNTKRLERRMVVLTHNLTVPWSEKQLEAFQLELNAIRANLTNRARTRARLTVIEGGQQDAPAEEE
jgi:hypothetical protein